jgi:hypothetical protein
VLGRVGQGLADDHVGDGQHPAGNRVQIAFHVHPGRQAPPLDHVRDGCGEGLAGRLVVSLAGELEQNLAELGQRLAQLDLAALQDGQGLRGVALDALGQGL